MKKTIKWAAGALAFVLVIAGAYFLYTKLGSAYAPNNLTSDSPQSQDNDDTDTDKYAAPDFTVTDYNGNKVKLSDLKGKPVVINFWATWCYYCTTEMPDFNEVCQKYEGKVQFMMVNMTDGADETVAKAKSHIESKGYTFPVYFDTELEAANAYSVTGLPLTYFVDSDGNLIAHARGAINAETLEKGISMISES